MAGMRRFSELLFLAVFLLMAALPVVRDEAPQAEPAAVHPNILVIMTDDQTVDDMRALPKTRALLGSRGTTFTNSFVSTALCCPSRSTFLTGQYAHNHGVLANAGPRGGYPRLDHSNTLPVWLQDRGLLHRSFRQVPQQLRGGFSRGAPGLVAVVRPHRPHDLPALRLQGERRRHVR